MYGIYTLHSVSDHPGTFKLDFIRGLPAGFRTKLKAQIYFDNYKKTNNGIIDLSRILEMTAADLYKYQHNIGMISDLNSCTSEMLRAALFYDPEHWKDCASEHSRNIYFKIY